MDDDDDREDTPPRQQIPRAQARERPRRIQTSEERDLESERRRRLANRTHPHGVVVRDVEADDEITDPVVLIERGPLKARTSRDLDAPATQRDILAVAEALTNFRRREKSNNEERKKQLDYMVDHAPSTSTAARIEKLEAQAAMARKLIVAALLGILGTLGTVAKGLYDRGGHETAIEMRIQALERAAAQPERPRVIYRDRSDREDPPLPTQKGQAQ